MPMTVATPNIRRPRLLLTPILVLTLVGTFITGCSDSSTSSGGLNFQRNTWEEGNAATLTSPADNDALQPGESYTFTWSGGAGPDAVFRLRYYDPIPHTFNAVFQAAIKNTGSYRTKLPSSLPQGVYMVNLKTHHYHHACFLGSITGYFSTPSPKVLAYSPSKDRVGRGHDRSSALNNCNNSNHPAHVPTNDCRIIDVNHSHCKSPAGGQSNSHFFSIGFVDQAAFEEASLYFEVENAAGARTVPATSNTGDTDNAANDESTGGSNIVQVGSAVDAADDQTVSHLAQSGTGGGR